jgi:hypothetical protein
MVAEYEVIKGPGRVTVELIKPTKPKPFWAILGRLWLYFFLVIGVLKLLSVIF